MVKSKKRIIYAIADNNGKGRFVGFVEAKTKEVANNKAKSKNKDYAPYGIPIHDGGDYKSGLWNREKFNRWRR